MKNGLSTTPVSYEGLRHFGMVADYKRAIGTEKVTYTGEKMNFFTPDMALFNGREPFRFLSNNPVGDQTMNIVS